ncbi:MAG: hypothetical protein KatS3mg031_0235 [Chitinophagales bacterium]|nr:MAG: hypothetical protein KatS3mg031_0235 [Chitinophagales bacterium]
MHTMLNRCLLILTGVLAGSISQFAFANGCTGSSFTLTYAPFCGCYQLCGGYGNALFISDCDEVTRLTINWGDGSPPITFSPNSTLPCHSYPPGTWTATLVIEGKCHQDDQGSIFGLFGAYTRTARCTKTQTITVGAPPTFEANFRADTVCLGQPTTFTNLSLMPGTINQNFFYDFGDGHTSSGVANPTHVFDSCGAYDVKLIISAQTLCCPNTGYDTIVKRVFVNCPPEEHSNALGKTEPYIYESFSAFSMNAVCIGDPTQFNFTPHDSITSFQYTFAGGTTSTVEDPVFTFTNCPPYINSVQLELTNTRGCTNILDTVATVYCVAINTANVTHALCPGECSGVVTVSPTGGTAPYSLNWTPGGYTTTTVSNLCAGTYTITTVDANGCTGSATVTVNEPPAWNGTMTIEQITCHGWNTGSAILSLTGGTPQSIVYPYYTDFLWSNGYTSNNNTNLYPGTYTVTVTDANGCQYTDVAVITEPPEITGTFNVVAANCGSCNGSATVIPSGGLGGGFTFSWNTSPPQTGATATGLCAGTYVVQITDQLEPACSKWLSVNVGNVGGPNVTITPTNVVCAGTCTGSATANVTCNNPPCSFQWKDAVGNVIGSNQNITGLCPGQYTVQVTNALGCVGFATTTIAVPNPLSVNLSSTGISCNGQCDGQVTAAVSGGTPSYTTQWYDISGTPLLNTLTMTSLCPGDYVFVVTDQQGCQLRDTITVQGYNLTGIATVTPIRCNGDCSGVISITANGGNAPYTFTVTDGSSNVVSSGNNRIITGLCADTYTVQITDNTGCAVTLPPVTVTQPSALSQSVSAALPSCYGFCDGSVTTVPSGGTPPYSYDWRDLNGAPLPGGSSATVNNLCPGTYQIRIFDANNCQTPFMQTVVNERDSLSHTLDVVHPYCGNNGQGSIDLEVSGGTPPYTYLWTGGATSEDLSGLAAGTYSVTVTDLNNCTFTDAVTLVTYPPISLSLFAYDYNGYEIRCYGNNDGWVQVTATGGNPPYTYQWNDPANSTTDILGILPLIDTLGILYAGTYTVTVTDASGCTAVDSITLNQPPPLSVTETHLDLLCFGHTSGTITVTPSGGVAPLGVYWYDDTLETSFSRSGLAGGTYYIRVYDFNNCALEDTIVIDEPDSFYLELDITNIACGNPTGSAEVIPHGGTPPYTYAWQHGPVTALVTGLAAGSYIVTVTDSNFCEITDTAVITEPAPMELNITALHSPCFGKPFAGADLTVNGGTAPYNYLWSDNSTQQNLRNVMAGSYSVTVTDNDGCTATESVNLTEPPLITASRTVEICRGSSFFVGGAVQTQAGVYADTFTNNQNCDSVLLTTLALLDSFVISLDTTLCYGDTFRIGNNSYASPGSFREVLTATGGCDSIVYTQLGFYPDIGLVVTPPDTTRILRGESVNINTTTSPGVTLVNYSWSPVEGLTCINCPNPIATPENSVMYQVTVTSSQGCIDSGYVIIAVDTLTRPRTGIYVPNAFSPNNDGINDTYYVVIWGYTYFKLTIFDRWGEKIFETRDPNVGWDGTFRGKPVNPGVYVYNVDADFEQGIEPLNWKEHKKGSLTVIR